MFFNFKILLFSLIFLIGLEIVSLEAVTSKLISEFFILAGVMLFSLWSAKKINARNIFLIIPLVYSLSSPALLYLIDSVEARQIFIALSFVMFYLYLLGAWRLKSYSGDQTAKGLIAASATATIFFFYTTVYGIYLNFLVPLWVLMILFLLATVFVSYQYFFIIKEKSRKLIWTYSLILGMIMAEIAWVINFWPFGYLTAGVISLIFYYILWDLAQSYFLNLLSRKRVVANMIFFTFLIGLILASSRWLPTV